MDFKLPSIEIPSFLKGDDHPPPAFHFKVAFSATLGLADTSFQEVSGIGAKLITEPVPEGGVNSYIQELPKEIQYDTLKLTRGIGKITSPLVIWCKSVFECELMVPIIPMPITVFLLNEKGWPCRAWLFLNAFPVAWSVDPFNSTKNEVSIEKIELKYTYLNRLF